MIAISRFAMFLVLTGLGAPAAQAACGPASLTGVYLYNFEGFGISSGLQPNTHPTASSLVFAAAGRLDAASGVFTWRDSSNLGGLIIRDRELNGTYDVDAGSCLGVLTRPAFGEIAKIVVAPDGSEFYFINSFDGVTITGVFRRQTAGSCTAGSATGEYRTVAKGAEWKGVGPGPKADAPSIAYGSVGRLQIATDSNLTGSFTWTTTDSTGGRISSTQANGTHRLDTALCLVHAEVNELCVDGACGPVSPGAKTFRLSAAPNGNAMVYINTTDHRAAAGWLYRQ